MAAAPVRVSRGGAVTGGRRSASATFVGRVDCVTVGGSAASVASGCVEGGTASVARVDSGWVIGAGVGSACSTGGLTCAASRRGLITRNHAATRAPITTTAPPPSTSATIMPVFDGGAGRAATAGAWCRGAGAGGAAARAGGGGGGMSVVGATGAAARGGGGISVVGSGDGGGGACGAGRAGGGATRVGASAPDVGAEDSVPTAPTSVGAPACPPRAVSISLWRRVGMDPARVSLSRSSASSRPLW